MSQKREHQRQKKAEKTRAKREALRRDGKASRPGIEAQRGGVPGRQATVEQASQWKPGIAWLSGNWHDQGAHVHAVISRRRDDGRLAAALFEVDLADRGVVDVKVGASFNDAMLFSEVGRRSDPEPMIEVDPSLAVKVVLAGRDHGQGRGHRQPRGLADALALLAGIEPSSTEIHCGEASAAAPADRPSLLGRIKAFFRRDEAPAPAIDPEDAPTDPGRP